MDAPYPPDRIADERLPSGGGMTENARRVRGLSNRTSWCFTFVMVAQDRQRDPLSEAREAHCEPREADLEHREAAVVAREADLEHREAAYAKRMDAANEILADADVRDSVADDRDAAADKRENAQDRAEWLDPNSDYSSHWPERRDAQADRVHSERDRMASRHHREALTEDAVEQDTDTT